MIIKVNLSGNANTDHQLLSGLAFRVSTLYKLKPEERFNFETPAGIAYCSYDQGHPVINFFPFKDIDAQPGDYEIVPCNRKE